MGVAQSLITTTLSSYSLCMRVEEEKKPRLPTLETPLRRLEQVGKEQLNIAELMAILIDGGFNQESVTLANQLLAHFGNIREVDSASIFELTTISNISKEQAARIQAGVELGRRVLATSPEDSPLIASPSDAVSILMPTTVCVNRYETVRSIIVAATRECKVKRDERSAVYFGLAQSSKGQAPYPGTSNASAAGGLIQTACGRAPGNGWPRTNRSGWAR